MKPSPRIRAQKLIAEAVAGFEAARAANDVPAAWTALERAHILSQPYLGPHLSTHWKMLGFATRQRDWREASGQVLRLILAPLGALTGRIPVGNTGRSNVSTFKAMRIPDDLQLQLKELGK